MAVDTDLASWQPRRHLAEWNASASLISMRNVGKRSSSTSVLGGIDFDISHGAVVVIVGRSASERPTLCRTTNRHETNSEGEIYFRGAPFWLSRKRTAGERGRRWLIGSCR
jgi:ABC-type polar amino acid transport system ATPase subunit